MSGQLNFALSIAGNTEALTRAAEGFRVVGNAANMASGPLGNTKLATERLGKSAEATRASMTAMQSVFAVFGGGVAPQVTGAVMLLANQFNALKSAISATGASMATLGLIGASAVTSFWAIGDALKELDRLTEAWDAKKKSSANLKESLDERKRYLTELGKLAVSYDMISQDERSDFNHKFIGSSTYGKNSLVSNFEKRLAEVGFLPNTKNAIATTTSAEAYQNTLALFQARNEGGDAAAREQIAQETGRQLKEAVKLATESGKPFEPLSQEIFKWRDKQLADLDKKTLPVDGNFGEGRTPRTSDGGSQNLTGLERLGLIIGTGVGGGINDPARNTAENTRTLVQLTGRLLDQVAKSSPSVLTRQ